MALSRVITRKLDRSVCPGYALVSLSHGITRKSRENHVECALDDVKVHFGQKGMSRTSTDVLIPCRQ
jgi:hypothetical protein